MRRPGHRADIQGLRGLAVLAVAAYHLDVGLHGGFLGVDVFFVVSGFVICTLLEREIEGGGRLDLLAFYGRRARRLLPALAVFLVATVTLAAVLTNPFDAQPLGLQTAASALVFVANLFLYRHVGYFDSSAAQNPFLHLWSLSLEEQFYLVFPLLLLVGWRLGRSRGLTWAVVGAFVASLGLAVVLSTGVTTLGVEAPERLAHYLMPTRAWELLAGALLALHWDRVARLGTRAAATFGTVGLVGLLVEFVVARSVTAESAPVPVVTVAATVLVLAAGSASGPATRLLSLGPLTVLGDWSYAWYLWHWPAIVFARALAPDRPAVAVAAAVAALVPAWASTRFVEAPARLRPTTVPATVRLATACTVIPALVIGMAGQGTLQGFGIDAPNDWWDMPMGRRSGCTLFNRDLANRWAEERCTTSVDPSAGTVLILGDQNADSVSPGAIDAAHRLGYGTALWNRTNCPFSASTPVDYPRCAQWNDAALALVDRLRPAAVVVVNQSTAYVDPDAPSVVGRADGTRPATRDEAEDIWRRGLSGLIGELRDRDVPVVLVGSIPDFEGRFPRERLSVIHPDLSAPSMSRRSFEAARRGVWTIERELVAGTPGVALVDPAERFCTPTCTTTDADGRWWYYEGRSLTRRGGEQLTTPLTRALRQVLGLSSAR